MGTLTPLLLAAAAWARPPEPPAGMVERAEVIEVGEVARQDGPWRIVDIDPSTGLELACADAPAPRRQRLRPSGTDVAWISGPFPPAVATPTGWWLPPADEGRFWAIHAPGCRIRGVAPRTDADRLDRLDLSAAGRTDLALRAGQAGIYREDTARRGQLADPGNPWDATWLAVRPASGATPVVGRPRPVDAARDRTEPDLPWRAEAGAPLRWEIAGPARVVLNLRPSQPVGEPIVVEIADPEGAVGARRTRPRIAEGAVEIVDGTVRPLAQPQAARMLFHVWVPAGPWTLVAGPDVTARLDRVDVAVPSWPGALPERPVVIPGAVPTPPLAERVRAEAEPGWPEALLLGPAPLTAAATVDGWSWLPASGDLPALPWTDAHGRASTWVTSPGRCEITAPDGEAWRGARPGLLHWWATDGAPTGRPPRVEGCEAFVRVQGLLTPHPDRHVATPTVAASPGAPGRLSFPTPTLPPRRLRVHVVGPTVVHVRTGRGRWTRWGVAPDGPPSWVDTDGRRWSAPVTLPLPDDGRTIEVRVDGPARIRADARAPAVADTPAAPVTPTTVPSVAEARSDAERAQALLRRVGWLMAAGYPREAVRDARLADHLVPGTLAPELRARVDRDTVRAWAPAGRWVADGSAVPAEVADDDVLDALERDDSAGAARRLAAPWSRPWWMAAARDAILDPATSQAARAAWVGAPDPGHGAFAGILGWSGWQRVRVVDGATPVRARPPARRTDPPIGLFPHPLDPDRAVRLDGVRLRLPPLPTSTPMRAACGATLPEGADGPCRLVLEDALGRTVASWGLSPWGRIDEVSLPPSDGPTFLRAEDLGPTHLHVELPAMLGDPDVAPLDAFETRDGSATVRLAGPSTLRLRTWPGLGGRLGSDDRESTTRPDPEGWGEVAWMDVPDGIHTVRVAVPARHPFLLHATVAETRDIEPPGHRRLLSRLDESRIRGPVEDLVLAPGPEGTPAPPPPDPRLTLVLSAEGRVGSDPSVDPEEVDSRPGRGRQELALHSRPWNAPVWFDVRAGVTEALGRTNTVEGSVAVEAAADLVGARLWTVLQGSYRTAARDTALHAFRGRLRLGAAWQPRSWADLRLRADLDAAARLGEWSARTIPITDGRLWSTWREDHPTLLRGQLELRLFPVPWVRTRLWAGGRSNAPGDLTALDLLEGGLEIRAGVPAVRAAAAFVLQRRLADSDRAQASTAPRLDLDVRGTLWLKRRLALQVGADLRWEPSFDQRVSAGLGVGLIWSGRPGLPDLRPTIQDVRMTDTWFEPGRWLPLGEGS